MTFLSFEEIDRLIKEDVPYIDLTSWSLGIREQTGRIAYFTREDCVVCGTEEVSKVFERLNIKIEKLVPSGEQINTGKEMISGTGRGCDINMAWKVGQNILDSCSGIATKTYRMVQTVKSVNPSISVLTTRKGFPGTKALATKAIMVGGAMPHRLGLSETVLIFKQHIDYIGGFDALLKMIPGLKVDCLEKKILVETSKFEEAKKLCEAGIDGIQLEKLTVDELTEIVKKLKSNFPHVILLATGGVNEENAAGYAKTGIDGIVTTSLYNANPVDVGVNINPLV